MQTNAQKRNVNFLLKFLDRKWIIENRESKNKEL